MKCLICKSVLDAIAVPENGKQYRFEAIGIQLDGDSLYLCSKCLLMRCHTLDSKMQAMFFYEWAQALADSSEGGKSALAEALNFLEKANQLWPSPIIDAAIDRISKMIV